MMKTFTTVFNMTLPLIPCKCSDDGDRFQAIAVYEAIWEPEKYVCFIDFVSKSIFFAISYLFSIYTNIVSSGIARI